MNLRRQLLPFLLLAVTLAVSVRAEGSDVGVAVVHSVAWAPGQPAREGAGEFLVLLQAAKLQRAYRAAGLLAVGDHNGVLRGGGERALRRLAVTGVVVVRLAPKGEVASMPDNVFVDAGPLTEAQAERVLARGLELYGAAPKVSAPEQPTERELETIRAHLRKFQELFAIESGARVALR